MKRQDAPQLEFLLRSKKTLPFDFKKELLTESKLRFFFHEAFPGSLFTISQKYLRKYLLFRI